MKHIFLNRIFSVCLFTLLLVVFNTNLNSEPINKGLVSLPSFNKGQVFNMFWDKDDLGIFTKFSDKENNISIIVRDKHCNELPAILSYDKEQIMVTFEKGEIILDGNTKKTSKIDNSGLIELDWLKGINLTTQEIYILDLD